MAEFLMNAHYAALPLHWYSLLNKLLSALLRRSVSSLIRTCAFCASRGRSLFRVQARIWSRKLSIAAVRASATSISQMALSSSSVWMERTGLAGADCARSSAVAMMISLGSLWLGPVSGVHPIAGPLPSGRMPGETLSGFRLAVGGDVDRERRRLNSGP